MAQQKKKHILSLAALGSAAMLVLIGSTMAFFTSTDSVTNRFAGSRVDITLTETKWDPETAQGVIPGDELDKNPQIINNEDIDTYVFMRVTVPCDTQMIDNDNGTPLGGLGSDVPLYKFMTGDGNDPESFTYNDSFSAAQSVHSHWSLVNGDRGFTHYDSEGKKYIYVYAYTSGNELAPVRKGEATEPLFDKLHLWNFSESGYNENTDHSVRVEALGIQADIAGHPADDISGIWAILEGSGS